MESKAGPSMDAQVARMIFGTIVIYDTNTNTPYMMGKDFVRIEVPPYSTDMETAESIIEFFQKKGFTFVLNSRQEEDGDTVYVCCFARNDGKTYAPSVATYAAEAVCVAALDAVTGKSTAPS